METGVKNLAGKTRGLVNITCGLLDWAWAWDYGSKVWLRAPAVIAQLQVHKGKEVWKVIRKRVCVRGTPPLALIQNYWWPWD